MSGRGRDGLVGVAQGGLSESAAGSVFEAEDDHDLWRGRGALADGHGRSLIAPFVATKMQNQSRDATSQFLPALARGIASHHRMQNAELRPES